MRSFSLKSVALVSRREKTARHVPLDPRRTLILGENHVGKSSLIKSIYWTLGADLKKEHTDDTWRDLDICGRVELTVDGVALTVVRHDRQFGVFQDGVLVWSGTGSTSAFAPWWAQQVGFGLLLSSSQTGETQLPPTSFYFLPYYIDQDSGWKSDVWGSSFRHWFKGNWKKDLVEYHVGLRDREYYQLKAKVAEQRELLVEPRQEERLLTRAALKLRETMAQPSVTLDLDAFEREVAELVRLASTLAAQQEDKRKRWSRLSNRKDFLDQQVDVVKAAHRELKGDYKFTVGQPHAVTCPTCAATYENSIAERFKLARDEHWCEQMLVEYAKELAKLEKDLERAAAELCEATTEYVRIQELLEVRRKEISLREVIRSTARNEAVSALQDQLDEARERINEISAELLTATSRLKELDAPARKKKLLATFNGHLSRNCIALRVPNLGPLGKFDATVSRTGSDKPRAVLAYRYAVLQMAWAQVGVTHAPLIIDSPNQQDQDALNLPEMLKFIRDKTPVDQQLVLGMVSTEGVKFDATIIELRDKRQLLRQHEYDSVGLEIEDLVYRAYHEEQT